MSKELKNKISSLPDSPGVYIFKDSEGKMLYIGKAKSLKKRVQSYFSRLLSTKTQVLVSKIADIEYRLTPSESQAQILEAALVKQHQPQYNISLKDDKSFPLIRIGDEEFSVVSICRRKKPKDLETALYFGPYTNVGLLRQAMKTIRRIFGFRSCKILPKKICLYGRINLCPAPCIGKISPLQYKEIIKNIILLLDSNYADLMDRLYSRMKEAAGQKRFEEAAQLRDQINTLAVITDTSKEFAGFSQTEELQNLLRLDKTPERIEAFDISNISGKEACGSMVSFYMGKPDKNNYRRFRIKTVARIDDYKMLTEVLRRRYSRLLRENLTSPDLILIDGGRSHLHVANRELGRLGLKIPLISIAKDRENIYVRGKRHPIRFTQEAPALNLLRRIRDEAHRFALSYHHVLRRKKILGK
jgi:excinuclease ABC subunit C